MNLDCSALVKTKLIQHMGLAHKMATGVCEEYFEKMRRHVYQTPKRFLQFLSDFNLMYVKKSMEITVKASRVEIGLGKLLVH